MEPQTAGVMAMLRDINERKFDVKSLNLATFRMSLPFQIRKTLFLNCYSKLMLINPLQSQSLPSPPQPNLFYFHEANGKENCNRVFMIIKDHFSFNLFG